MQKDEILKLSEKAIKLINKKIIDFGEIYFENTKLLTIKSENSRIEKITKGEECGFSIRLVKDEKTFFSYSIYETEEKFLEILENLLIKISNNQKEDNQQQKNISLKIKKLSNLTPILISPENISIEEKIDIVNRIEKASKESEYVIQSLAMYSETIKDIYITTIEGEFYADKRSYITAISQVSVFDKNQPQKGLQTGYEADGGNIGFEFFTRRLPESIGKEALRLALHQLFADLPKGGYYPIVISSSAGGTMVHEAVGHGLEADFIHKKISVYTDKLGKKVASEKVSIIDDGTLTNKRGTTNIDDEGVIPKRVVLIENGILKGFLTDKKYAKKLGIELTGNGRRQSFRHIPIPRMRNTFIAPGKDDPDKIISSLQKGILVKKMGGGQVDIVTGDFVFFVQEAYLIENYKITKPLKGVILFGNGPKVIEEIDMVGWDLGFGVGTCGKDGQGVPVSDAQPTIRISKLLVGGKT
jgi:TldD protein